MKKVLLLDDERSTRSMYAEVIRQAGFEAKAVSSVEEGLQYIDEHGTPDLIVTEINMPGIGGIEFCKRVRSVAKSTPILMMGKQVEQGLVSEAKAVGIQGWMQKPVPPEQLMNTLNLVIG